MNTRPTLVNLEELRGLIRSLELNDQRKEYISARWLKYIEWWDFQAKRAKWYYLALRGSVVFGCALLPALVSLREIMANNPYAWIVAVASIFVSFVIAVCAGFESLYGFGDIWREKRNAAELIKSEGFYFLQLTGVYKNMTHAEAYETFAGKVEDLIVKEIRDYIIAVSPKPGTGSPKPETVAAKPETVAIKPETVATKPDTVATKPKTVATKPGIDSPKPETVARKPDAVGTKPDTGGTKPETGTG